MFYTLVLCSCCVSGNEVFTHSSSMSNAEAAAAQSTTVVSAVAAVSVKPTPAMPALATPVQATAAPVRFSLSGASIGAPSALNASENPAMQARMNSLLKEVRALA